MFGLFGKGRDQEDTEPGPFGRFRLVELISSGGMAHIWLATDEQGRAHALRRMHSNIKGSLSARRRFFHGCDVLASVQSHRCVIGYFEHGKIEGNPFLLMEYVEGDNLKELYARHDPVLLENVAQILLDAGEGLEHVHESGYMHLDFKPENILVSRNGGVKLVDFDLARPITDTGKRKKNPGTPAYMAPEQLAGEPFDHRVDIFAFGVAAYELLTNQKPFAGETASEILASQLDRANLVRPRDHNPDIPAKMEAVIMKCLALDPNERYHFASILNHDLRGALYVK